MDTGNIENNIRTIYFAVVEAICNFLRTDPIFKRSTEGYYNFQILVTLSELIDDMCVPGNIIGGRTIHGEGT